MTSTTTDGLNEAKIYTLADMTQEFAEQFYDTAVEGWTTDDGRIEWEATIERFESYTKDLGIDFGPEWDTPAIRRLQRLVRAIHAEQ